MALSNRATTMARRTSNAVSAGSYRSWPALAQWLYNKGHNDKEVEAILRSKWTRWGRDASPHSKGTTKSFETVYNTMSKNEIADLVSGTFPEG